MTRTQKAEAKSEEGEVARHIARAAARLFAERGYDATSVREIVEAAGVTKPTLYYHFGSKQGLGEALLTRPMTEFLAVLRALNRDEADPIRLLTRTIEAHLSLLRDEPDRARFFYAICFGPSNTSLQEEMHRFNEAMAQEVIRSIARLAEAGVIEPGRVEAFSEAFRGFMLVTMMDSIFEGRELPPELASRFVNDLLRGFARPGVPLPEIQPRDNP